MSVRDGTERECGNKDRLSIGFGVQDTEGLIGNLRFLSRLLKTEWHEVHRFFLDGGQADAKPIVGTGRLALGKELG